MMGDIADLIIEGVLCQECHCLIDDTDDTGPAGHPRFCRDCGGDPDCNYAIKKKRRNKWRRRKLPSTGDADK